MNYSMMHQRTLQPTPLFLVLDRCDRPVAPLDDAELPGGCWYTLRDSRQQFSRVYGLQEKREVMAFVPRFGEQVKGRCLSGKQQYLAIRDGFPHGDRQVDAAHA